MLKSIVTYQNLGEKNNILSMKMTHLGIYPPKNLCWQKNLDNCIHRSIIHNGQTLEITKIIEQTVVYTYHRILFSNKKEQNMIHATIWLSVNSGVDKKKKIWKGHVLYDSIYKTFSDGRILEMEKRLPGIKNVGKVTVFLNSIYMC